MKEDKYTKLKKLERKLKEVDTELFNVYHLFSKKSRTRKALIKFKHYLRLLKLLGWRNKIWDTLPCLDLHDLYRMSNGLSPILDKRLRIEGIMTNKKETTILYMCKLCGEEYPLTEIKKHLTDFHKVSAELGNFYTRSGEVEVMLE